MINYLLGESTKGRTKDCGTAEYTTIFFLIYNLFNFLFNILRRNPTIFDE